MNEESTVEAKINPDILAMFCHYNMLPLLLLQHMWMRVIALSK